MKTNVKIVEKNKVKVKKPKHFKVIMHNDDFTTMEFVVAVLITVFNKTVEESNKIMMGIHKNGMGIAGIYPYDIAVSKMSKAMILAKNEDFPFKVTMEEV